MYASTDNQASGRADTRATTAANRDNRQSRLVQLTKRSLQLLGGGFAVSVCLSMLAATQAVAGSFSITKIADTRSDFTNIFNGAAINDSGTVAFVAAPNSTQQGVYISNGSAITEIINSNGLPSLFNAQPPLSNPQIAPISYSFVPLIDINNNGTVAFIANQTQPSGARDTTQKIFVSQDGAFTTRGIVLNSPRYGGESISAIALNNQEQLTYLGRTNGVAFPNSNRIVLTSASQPDVTITTAGTPRFGSSVPETPFSSITDVANNTGEVTFAATRRSDNTSAIFTSRGGEPTSIVENPASALGVNDNGDVALSSGDAIRLLDRASGLLTTIADTSGSFNSLSTPAINNDREVAFTATLNSGEKGIFTGADPVEDKVVATGDTLEGSTVTDLNFLRSGLNNNGQIAFYAHLADGTQGIFRAEPSEVETPRGASASS